MSGAALGIAGFANGFVGARADIRARDERKAEADRQDRLIAAMENNPGAWGATGAMGVDVGTGGYGRAAPPSGGASNGIFGLIDDTEGGGNYSTLYGNAQNGGRFDGVDVSKMTLADLYAFSDPNGEYGQWVKQANPEGVVATPMGRHQIVGTTARNAANEMGLPPTTVFSPEIQDAMANHLARKRLAAGSTPAAKRAQLRAEWAGFRGVSDADLDAAIADFEGSGGTIQPRAMGVGPT